jgi:uncharacterized repeat protein (TIGR01451 family)/fimbrial isopeptide formation D2 family protein
VVTHTLVNTGDVTDTFRIEYFSEKEGIWGLATITRTLPYTVTLGPNVPYVITSTYTPPPGSQGQLNTTVYTATALDGGVRATVVDQIRVKTARWEISKVVTPSLVVQPGDLLTYTITVSNTGELDTSAAYTVSDVLPQYTTFVSADPAADQQSPVVQWITDTVVISYGGSAVFTYVVRVDQPLTDSIAIVNQVYTVTGGDAFTRATGIPVTVPVDAPALLTATKRVNPASPRPGDVLTYTISITNQTGALGPALGVIITDVLPAEVVPQQIGFVGMATGTTAITDQVVTWWLADAIQPDETVEVTAAVRMTSPLLAGTVLNNQFVVTASNQLASVTGVLTTPVNVTNIITVAKTADPISTTSGQDITYTITITNSGDGIATVAITDELSPEFQADLFTTVVTVPGRTWDSSAGTASVSFTATVPITPDNYSNAVITVTYDAEPPVIITDTAPVTVEVPATDIEVNKLPQHQFAHSGDIVTFTIAITNTGEGDLRPITVTDVAAPVCSRVITSELMAGALFPV